MNSTIIRKAAALFLASTSCLGATTTSQQPKTTQDRVNEVNKKLLELWITKMNFLGNTSTENNKIKHFSIKIENLRKQIKKLITSDRSIINHISEDSNNTILIRAASCGHTKIVDFLLKEGANVEATDNHGSTSLIEAASRGHKNTCKALLSIGANINATDNDLWTSLMFAVWEVHYETIELLLTYNANITIKNNEEKTALDLANEKSKLSSDDKAIKKTIKLLKAAFNNEANNPTLRAANKETARLLEGAPRNLYGKRAFWFLLTVFLLALTGWGTHHYISELKYILRGLAFVE